MDNIVETYQDILDTMSSNIDEFFESQPISKKAIEEIQTEFDDLNCDNVLVNEKTRCLVFLNEKTLKNWSEKTPIKPKNIINMDSAFVAYQRIPSNANKEVKGFFQLITGERKANV